MIETKIDKVVTQNHITTQFYRKFNFDLNYSFSIDNVNTIYLHLTLY